MHGSVETYPFQRRRPLELPEQLAKLQRDVPVARVPLAFGGEAYLITRHQDVRAVLGDPRFSRGPGRQQAVRAEQRHDEASAGGSFDFGLSIAEPPGHGRWRRIVNGIFTPAHAESMRPRIRELVAETIDDLTAAPPPGDLMEGFAFRLPMKVICELFGVPDGARPRFDDWAASLRDVQAMDSFGAAMRDLSAYAADLIEQKRRRPGPDVISQLIGVKTTDADGLSDRELVSTVLLLTIAGYQTTAVQFGNAFQALFLHDGELERLRRSPEAIPLAVEEILRYAQASTGLTGGMHTTTEVVLEGVTIPAGSVVFVSLDAANRDPAVFSCPHSFDLSRGSARRHVAFGSGPHFCLGAPVARVELQEGLAGVLQRLPELRLEAEPAVLPLESNLFSQYPRALPVSW